MTAAKLPAQEACRVRMEFPRAIREYKIGDGAAAPGTKELPAAG